MKRSLGLGVLILFLMAACREKYTINVKSTDKSVLVVEGFLNAGTGSTSISLTRSYNVNSPGVIPKVSGAQVKVEGDDGSSFTLTESGNTGVYSNPQLTLLPIKNYRLRIKTSDSREYLSDYVPVKASPAIDSINWKWENNGVMVYANTHDASNNSRYYKWEFDETWEIQSTYFSFYKVVGDTIIERNLINDDVSRCWKYDRSKSIILGSTAQLQSDVIFETPVNFIQKSTEKLGVRYSILLKQQVLTKQAYEFFQLMKKNTELQGSIFDPLPSELRGNIKCLTNPEEQVVGYVTASTQQEKRIFISSVQLPLSQFTVQGCYYFLVSNKKDSLKKYIPAFLPWGADMLPSGTITGYYVAPPVCVDCTLRGGANVKPSYW
jgi:hypothetical protein